MNLRKINILKKAMLDTIFQNFTPALFLYLNNTKLVIYSDITKLF